MSVVKAVHVVALVPVCGQGPRALRQLARARLCRCICAAGDAPKPCVHKTPQSTSHEKQILTSATEISRRASSQGRSAELATTRAQTARCVARQQRPSAGTDRRARGSHVQLAPARPSPSAALAGMGAEQSLRAPLRVRSSYAAADKVCGSWMARLDTV